jgi:homoserine dehydrogenase
MSKKNLKLGIFGFGCVGQGLYDVLQQTKGIRASIEKICIKHPEKKRSIDASYFTTDPTEILNNPEIDIVVELIDDAEAAYEITKTALKRGKAVVSANKKMIAEHLPELYALQQEYKTPLLYEGSSCASIPIIRNLEEYYDNDLLSAISGVFNGSTNYILSQMWDHAKDYNVALKEAQDKGFAESDPTLDVGGFDPKFKLCITILHAFGLFVQPEEIFNYGIQQINQLDVAYAQQQGKKIKLLASAQRNGNEVTGFVLPAFVDEDNPLVNVHNEFNGIILEGAFANSQFFLGKGAGSSPTGSAVLSDISALTYDYKYEYKKIAQNKELKFSTHQLLEVYVRYKNTADVFYEDFEAINQQFESKDYRYVIGEIDLAKLREGQWANNPNLSIIVNKVLTGPQEQFGLPRYTEEEVDLEI